MLPNCTKQTNKAAELEISAKTVLLTMSSSLAPPCQPRPPQVSHFHFGQKSTVDQCHAHGKVADAHAQATQFLFSLSDRQQTQSKQATATTTTAMMVTGPTQTKQGQVWHQVKKTTVGLEFMEQMCFGIVLKKKPIRQRSWRSPLENSC